MARHTLYLGVVEIDDRSPEAVKATVPKGLEAGTTHLWTCEACDFWALPDDLAACSAHVVEHQEPE